MMLRKLFHVLVALGLSGALALVFLLSHSAPPHSPVSEVKASDVITYYVHLPIITNGPTYLTVDPTDRAASQAFFDNVYLASAGVEMDWSGNHAACAPGDTSQAFKDAMLVRINYFRAMAGVPPLEGLSEEYNRKAQQAALMMSVNRTLSHAPDESWECYTTEGDEAAGSSNLYLGRNGPTAIDGYIADYGSGNTAVGHRRWILYPQTEEMGTGDIPFADGYPGANALWVFDDTLFGPRPETRDGFVAWPPPGFVPEGLVFPRWSFSYPGADFYDTTIEMTVGGAPVSLNKLSVANGYGENTVVWEPDPTTFAPETTYIVTLDNVQIEGSPQTFTYEVTLFDPYATTKETSVGMAESHMGRPLRTPARRGR
jgi:uncharacterized protein YkwD